MSHEFEYETRDALREEMYHDMMSRYDDVHERFAGSEIDPLSEMMMDEEWDGTREEYLAELDRREDEYRARVVTEVSALPETDDLDDILF